jgi:hypothetical protein
MGNANRAEYCHWFGGVITANEQDVLDVTFFTDEAWFRLCGYVNSQNNSFCSATNPYEIKDIPL